jgi:hypothetical protein
MVANISNAGLSVQVLLSTLRLVTTNNDGTRSIGTGFFFGFDLERGDHTKLIPAVITNRHVMSDALSCELVFRQQKEDEHGIVIGGPLSVDLAAIQDFCVYHPDVSVDLCAILILPIHDALIEEGLNIHTKYWAESSIPDAKRLSDFEAVVDVIMAGYPFGMQDELLKTPIFRKGITATPPASRFNDNPEFLVDIAAFKGSSGSPIFLYYPGPYVDSGEIKNQGKILLIGVLYRGDPRPVPTQVEIARSNMKTQMLVNAYLPNHLGYAIQATEITGPLKGAVIERINEMESQKA